MLENPHLPWNWIELSSNPNVTWDIVKQNPDKSWHYGGLFQTRIGVGQNCLQIQALIGIIVSSNPDKPWNYCYLSSNPNITWKIVADNLDKDWNWYRLSCNKMCHDPYFQSAHYRKKKLKEFWENSKEEFIAKTWHPICVNRGWCLDEVDRKERFDFYGI